MRLEEDQKQGENPHHLYSGPIKACKSESFPGIPERLVSMLLFFNEFLLSFPEICASNVRFPFEMSGSGGNPLDQLEQQLERSIENVRQIRIIVSDFQPQGQPALNKVRPFRHAS